MSNILHISLFLASVCPLSCRFTPAVDAIGTPRRFLLPGVVQYTAMTTEEARKILGDESTNVSDEDLQKEIEAAELLKNIFFSMLHKKRE
jgi:hypothetical protein